MGETCILYIYSFVINYCTNAELAVFNLTHILCYNNIKAF